MGRPTRFVAESYWPGAAPDDIAAAVRRTRQAAAGLEPAAGRARLLRCTLTPTDELCYWLFEADSEATIRLLGGRASLDFERVSPAVDVWPPARIARS